MAARAHGGRARRRRSRSCWAGTGSSGRGCGSRSGRRRGRGLRSRTIDAMDDDRERPVASLVRDPLPDPESVGEDEVLVGRLRAAITPSGPISFARFMARALYEPGHGYYRRPDPGPGHGRRLPHRPRDPPDLRRAPSAGCSRRRGPRSGVRRRSRSSSTAPGPGALAEGLLAALRDAGSPLFEAIRYRPVEVELARLEALRARLDAAGLGGRARRRDGDSDGGPVAGAVVANEVLDALPVHRVIGRPGGIREQLVGLDAAGGFAWVEADPTTAELAERLGDEGIELEDGQAAEVCLGVDDLARRGRRRPRPRGRRPRRLRGGARVPPRARGGATAPCAGSPGTPSAATRSATWAART